MTGRLDGKRAVITGGGRGIGRAIALAYAAEGARCVITSRKVADLESAAAEAPAGALSPIVCDVGDDDSVSAMAAGAVDALGGVDIVVNNAGVHAAGRFLDIAPQTFADLYNVNVVGVVRVSQAFVPAMIISILRKLPLPSLPSRASITVRPLGRARLIAAIDCSTEGW